MSDEVRITWEEHIVPCSGLFDVSFEEAMERVGDVTGLSDEAVVDSLETMADNLQHQRKHGDA